MITLWKKIFVDHPNSVNESYFEHLCSALYFSSLMILGGIASLIHSLVPLSFVKTGSGIITHLYDRMVLNRDAYDAPPVSTDAHAVEKEA
jgi:hypothetical protein